ncbi:hypothetical protein TCAL_02073 [Tigriopus californicus]|uniref:Midasin n=1 Tax=Tigriopus californicus TaxID=6832 RepID=A0A553NEW7_TIGCA|nr:midasin-like [Tigriopus californicus]TRY63986.1 hypothetical protein TCAL_02073 [Tigriopus californicus]|eukprot:TCALIF_02073-PA protein Name:"Similar to MDN1 Midasin (Homo sapiens)" AED:0.02 eAED:0.02 QI:0/1/0.33/1/1/1/3/52/4537
MTRSAATAPDLAPVEGNLAHHISQFLDPSVNTVWIRSHTPLLAHVLPHLQLQPQDPDQVERVLVALARCLHSQAHLWPLAQPILRPQFPIFQRFLGRSPAWKSPEPRPKKRKTLGNPPLSDQDVLQAALILVETNPYFHHLWAWSDLLARVHHFRDDATVWYAIETLARVFQYDQSRKWQMVPTQVMGPDRYRALTLSHLAQRRALANGPAPEVRTLPDWPDVNPAVIWVSTVPLLKVGDSLPDPHSPGFMTFGDCPNRLRQICLSIHANQPVLIRGPIASGKTSLVEHLARLTGRDEGREFHRIQITDQTDGRSLLGGYTCSQVPGHFVWKSGPLAEAVTRGHWLLIEDIDQAQIDVVSTLLPLLESKALYLPSKGSPVTPAPGFQLFLTQRDSELRLGGHPVVVDCPPLDQQDMFDLAEPIHPLLVPVLPKIIGVLVEINGRLNRNRDRLFTVRDLLSWGARCVEQCPTGDMKRDILFQESIHVFCNHLAHENAKFERASLFAQVLNINSDQVDYYVNERTAPVTYTTNNTLKVGRTSLDLAHSFDQSMPFCLTSQSSNLLEFLTISVLADQACLLVGETGVGKTTTVQFLSKAWGRKLHVINLCEQSEASDLFGGFKPVDLSFSLIPIIGQFKNLCQKSYSVKRNRKVVGHLTTLFHDKNWLDLLDLCLKISSHSLHEDSMDQELKLQWEQLNGTLLMIKQSVSESATNLFAFVSGVVTEAIKNGDWVLLDEVNMAEKELLIGVISILTNSRQISLSDGESQVSRHPNFRLFACMNPSTDVGKRDLPPALRNRFLEYYLGEPKNRNDLEALVNEYLKNLHVSKKVVSNVLDFYLNIKSLSQKRLCDGTGHKPSFSLRTLCRALSIASRNPTGNIDKSLTEAFCICFLTELDKDSYPIVLTCILKYFPSKSQGSQEMAQPSSVKGERVVKIEGFWMKCGKFEPLLQNDYILTNSVRQNLKDLARIISLSEFPVLIQGETSVGKTSLISYLAKASGNHCVRINNHEHTDIQEYVGSYGADASGAFVFNEGALAKAMREGHWVILDELNLASTEILEALNRVLDDNRELFIPETQTVIKAHKLFRVFATQNPAGTYGGRKVLSRAFRNRFVELHFDELPNPELEVIIEKKCAIPKAMSKKMVKVMSELQLVRKASEAFQGKKGFITLRDLFRWGFRYSKYDPSTQFHDWDLHVAEEGYLVLGSRLRVAEDAEVVAKVLEKVFKRKIDVHDMFQPNPSTSLVLRDEMKILSSIKDQCKIVWTRNARRMASLLLHSAKFEEPVLLVGQTGCGKTSVCQIVCDTLQQTMNTINCHLNTDASDFLGSLRPCRDHSKGKLFEWKDGPLIDTMISGHIILVDEISLADDSVIERLNPVLERDRAINLSERLSDDSKSDTLIVAHEKFRLFATMNPGGDYGKKELSPALRNRFFEIWCPSHQTMTDVTKILRIKLPEAAQDEDIQSILDFLDWYQNRIQRDNCFSIRDIDTWSSFIRSTHESLGVAKAIVQGALLVFLDGLATTESSMSPIEIQETRRAAIQMLVKSLALKDIPSDDPNEDFKFQDSETSVSFGLFTLPKKASITYSPSLLNFRVSTVLENAFKISRGLQVDRPILLEGPPGAGKSTMVKILARATGNKLVRINLSDQTDIADLFGTDLPAENEAVGTFSWHNGAFLSALQAGHWILLDELNLATQSVLEGLNACLDHRGEVFIPELNKTFFINKQSTRIFGTQNPSKDGSGRKGLPQSFLNRFTKVYVQEFTPEDIIDICTVEGPLKSVSKGRELATKMTQTLVALREEVNVHRSFGIAGSPWSFNIRDVLRWSEAVQTGEISEILKTGQLLLTSRFRTREDLDLGEKLVRSMWNMTDAQKELPTVSITQNYVSIGSQKMSREIHAPEKSEGLFLLRDQLPYLESLMMCIQNKWIPIITGQSGSGKTSLVEVLAQLINQPLCSITMNATTDTTELLGTFEQTDEYTTLKRIREAIEQELKMIKVDTDALLTIAKVRESLAKDRGIKIKDQIEDLIIICHSLGRDFPQTKQSVDDLGVRLAKLQAQRDNVLNSTFAWVDSVLVKAVEQGQWLLIDNANFCDSSVLDRLNGLFEPDGVLTIGEQGCRNDEVRTVFPHANFRVFLTMDPKNGELSHAMRNRGVEIFVHSGVSGHDLLMANLRSKLSAKRAEAIFAKYFAPLRIDLPTAARMAQQIHMEMTISSKIEPTCKQLALDVSDYVDVRIRTLGSPSVNLINFHPSEYQLMTKCALVEEITKIYSQKEPMEPLLCLFLSEMAGSDLPANFLQLFQEPQKFSFAIATTTQESVAKLLNPFASKVDTKDFESAQSLAKLDKDLGKGWKKLMDPSTLDNKIVLFGLWKLCVTLKQLRESFAKDTLEEVWEAFHLHWIVWRDLLTPIWTSEPDFGSVQSDLDSMVDLSILGTLKLWSVTQKSLPIPPTFHDEALALDFRRALTLSHDWSVYKCQDARELQAFLEIMNRVVLEGSLASLPDKVNVTVKSEKDQTIRTNILDLFKAHCTHVNNCRVESGSSIKNIPTYPLLLTNSAHTQLNESQLRTELTFYSIMERKICDIFGLNTCHTGPDFVMKILFTPGTLFSQSPIAALNTIRSSLNGIYLEMSKSGESLKSAKTRDMEHLEETIERDFSRISRLLEDLSDTRGVSFNELIQVCRQQAKIPTDLAELLNDLVQVPNQACNSPKYVQLLQAKILTGLVFFHLAHLLSKVDMKALLETEAEILTLDAQRSETMIISDTSLKILHLSTSTDVYDHNNPLMTQAKIDLEKSKSQISVIKSRIPVRLESSKALLADFARIAQGPLSRENIHGLVREIMNPDSKSDLEARLKSWSETLVQVKLDFEQKYPTFRDVWTVGNLGLCEVISGVMILKQEFRNNDELARKINTFNTLESLYHGEFNLGHLKPNSKGHCNVIIDIERDLKNKDNLMELLTCGDHADILSNSLKNLEDDLPPSKCKSLQYLLIQMTGVETTLKIPSRFDSFIQSYKKDILELSNVGEDSYIGLEVHKKALAYSIETMKEESKAFPELETLSSACREIIQYVQKSLLSKWPDNVLLMDIIRGSESILSHSLSDPRKEYKMALENLLVKIGSWNKNAFCSIMIHDEKLAGILESWRLQDVKSTRSLPNELLKGIYKDTIVIGATCLRVVLQKAFVKTSKQFLALDIGHMLMVFMLQSHVNDFQLRLNILKHIANLLEDADQSLFRIARNVHAYFSQYLDQFSKAKSGNINSAKKKVGDVLKAFTNKRHKDWEQFSRQKKKLSDDCLELMKMSVPQLISVPPGRVNEESTRQACSNVTPFQEPKFKWLEYGDAVGQMIGNSLEMFHKVKKANKLIGESLCDLVSKIKTMWEDIDALDPFLKQLNNKEFKTSNDKHKAQKMVENLLKELRDDGLSFRIGGFQVPTAAKVNANPALNLVAQVNDVMRCSSKFDSFCLALTTPQEHVNPMVHERTKGTVSHGLMQLVKGSHVVSCVKKDLEFLKGLLSHLQSVQRQEEQRESEIKRDTLSRALKTLGQAVIDPYLEMAQDDIQLDRTIQMMHKIGKDILSVEPTSELVLKHIEHLEVILRKQDSHFYQDVREQLQKVKNLHQIQAIQASEGRNASMAKLPESALNDIKTKVLNYAKKWLNTVQTLKKSLTQIDLKESPFLDLNVLLEVLLSLQMNSRVKEVEKILNLRRQYYLMNVDCSKLDEILLEAIALILPCLEPVAKLLSVAEAFVNVCGNHLWKITDVFHQFVIHEFPKQDEEEQEGDSKNAESQKLDGCGLGEGKGEKATTEDVEDEDLFDNQPDPNEKEQEDDPEDKSEAKEEEDHIDYSDKLDDGQTKDREEKEQGSDDDKDDNSDEEKDEPSDVEETNVDDDDKLQPEDWGSDVEEDEDDKKDDKEKAEKEKDPHRKKDASAAQEKDDEEGSEEEPDETNVEKEENPRTRQPDEKEEENGDVEMKDDEYQNLPEDIEPEDLDLEDDANMDGNDDDEEMDPMEQEEEDIRLPDFVDEEPEKDDSEEKDQEESNPLGDAQNDTDAVAQSETANETSDKSTILPKEEEAQAEKDDDKEGPDSMEQQPQKKGASNAEEQTEPDQIEDAGKEEDQAEPMDVEEGDRVEEEADEMCLEVQDKLEIERSQNVLDDVTSKTFAHLNSKEQATESAASTLDEVAFEKMKELKLKVDKSKKTTEEKDKSEQSQPKELKQELGQTLSEDDMQVLESKRIDTMTVSRGDASQFGQSETWDVKPTELEEFKDIEPDVLDVHINQEHLKAWTELCNSTAELSRTLTEQLRLIIEPTKATRLRGDYKSGKRINIRKVIPYIASHFRKDKIWLRRTKPSKRDCEIMVALDDSSSMSDNQVQHLSFQALSTLCQALSVLEIGKMGVVRFGEKVSVVLPPKTNFSINDGAQLVSQFSFDQNVTRIVELLRVCSSLYSLPTDRPLSKLLIVISDGKGILNEGKMKVEEAVRNMKLQNVFTIFVIVEASASSESVLDIRAPVFDDLGNLRSIDSYMASFPFPFYIILREVKNLPIVLSDALRQWMELVTSSN